MTWTRDEVVAFLSHAYSKFQYRNVGVLVQAAYVLQCQFKELFELKWCDVDDQWDSNLLLLLQKQKADFGFQDYVAPQIKPQKGKYVPYNKYRFSKIGRRIITESKINNKLLLRYLPYS